MEHVNSAELKVEPMRNFGGSGPGQSTMINPFRNAESSPFNKMSYPPRKAKINALRRFSSGLGQSAGNSL